jgi:hypothetical protein
MESFLFSILLMVVVGLCYFSLQLDNADQQAALQHEQQEQQEQQNKDSGSA